MSHGNINPVPFPPVVLLLLHGEDLRPDRVLWGDVLHKDGRELGDLDEVMGLVVFQFH